jgi:ribosomal protein S18 acetylase RimI-like enzyme
VAETIRKNWGSDFIVSRGNLYDTRKLDGFIAYRDRTPVGELTYRIENSELEIVTINSLIMNQGIGSQLLDAAKRQAIILNCTRLWLITTNDNLDALRFYQKHGMELVTIHRNAIETSRKLKPNISKIGHYGIPIRDEIELEMKITR